MNLAQALHPAPSPWSGRYRVILAVLLALGVIGLIAGYVGTSGTVRVSRQVAWLNLAGTGLLVSGAGIVLFLAAGRREIGRRRLGLFGDAPDQQTATTVPDSKWAPDLVSADTMRKYHRADCPFVEGKAVAAASAAVHEAAGRRRCGVCLAEGES